VVLLYGCAGRCLINMLINEPVTEILCNHANRYRLNYSFTELR
jgi:hypothetical protein